MITVMYSPGPNTISSMINGIREGFKGALKFIAGIFPGFLIAMNICAIFSKTLLVKYPFMMNVMKAVGGIYILYLSYKIFTLKKLSEDSSGSGFLSGFILQFLNPKIYFMGITVMSQFILPYYDSYKNVFLFTIFMTCVSSIGCILYALFGSLIRKYYEKNRVLINTLMALALLYCAISIFLS